jgi:hypothetical protein
MRVARFHRETIKSVLEVLGAAGFDRPQDLKPRFVMRRVSSSEVRSYHDIYPPVTPDALLSDSTVPESMARAWDAARSDRF